LDVTTPEPLPTDDRLLKLKNCLILPHIGSADVAARHQMAQICVDNLLNFFSGKPLVHEIKIEKA
jgi:phosphoglycerate dehydrogenase-like enzyme